MEKVVFSSSMFIIFIQEVSFLEKKYSNEVFNIIIYG